LKRSVPKEMLSPNKGIIESEIKSLSDYLLIERDRYSLQFWICGKLIPYQLKNDSYQWVVFPVDLETGNYRLCFTVNMGGKRYPIVAFAVIYPSSVRTFPIPYHHLVGIGFKFSPMCVAGEKFTYSRNTSDFTVRQHGKFNVCATTSNWTPQVNKTTFELLLLQKRT
jgi:hypothetical protein